MVDRKEGIWTVYRHISPSGKIYVGITSRKPERRWGHGCNYADNIFFYRAIMKYGWDNIKHEILFTGLPESRAKNLEIALIRHYKNLGISYNMTDGGDGVIGLPDSPKRLEAVKRYWKGRHLSEEHKKKISLANMGKPAPNKGKHYSPEIIAKRVAGRKGKKVNFHIPKEKLTEIRRTTAKTIPVCQYTLDGEFIAKYFSMGEAARQTGTHPNGISACCSGVLNQSNGYIWKKAV